MKKSKIVPTEVTAGLDTVAIRTPSNQIALALIRASKVPIAAPSANSSGKPSPTSASHVVDDLFRKIDCIIDGGQTDVGIESTVISLVGEKPLLLRPGKITLEQLEKVLKEKVIVKNKLIVGESPHSPGMKYKHYSPKAQVVLFVGKKDFISKKDFFIKKFGKEKIGIICLKNFNFSPSLGIQVSHVKNLSDYAKNVFALFREFDSQKKKLFWFKALKKKVWV